MRTPDGRRVMIGWMQNPHILTHSPSHGKWMGQMSLPRELYWKEGHLCQKPVRELELLRTNRVEYRNVMVNGLLTLDGIRGRAADLELTVRPASSEQYRSFSIHFAQNENFRTSLIIDPLNSTVTIDRTISGSRRALLHRRTIKVEDGPECLKLRLILDQYSAEIFINDGADVMTATLYTELSAQEISFFCDGTAIIDIVKYDITV